MLLNKLMALRGDYIGRETVIVTLSRTLREQFLVLHRLVMERFFLSNYLLFLQDTRKV